MLVHGIDTKDISVIVQGAIDKNNTPKSLKSISNWLPGAEIILSTWENADTSGLKYDKVLYNKDPGGVKDKKTSFVNNLNRQIVSTTQGIRASNRKYIFKLRSDLILTSNNFLKYWDDFPVREAKYCAFRHRVIFCSLFFKRYLGEFKYVVEPTPFHMSDWLAFGLREDIQDLFDVPLTKEPNFSNYSIENQINLLKINMFGASHQYAPEQYIFMKCIEKFFEELPRFRNICDYSPENINFSNKIVSNNCIILDPRQFRIYCGKNGIDPYKVWSRSFYTIPHYVVEGLITHLEFWKMYIENCDKRAKVPRRIVFLNKINTILNKYFVVHRINRED